MKRLHLLVTAIGRMALIIAVVTMLSGCSLPRIIILHDPLSAGEHDDLGRIYESQGKPELALEQYREALKQDKKHVPSLLLLGDLLYRMKDYAGAESALIKALALDPKNGDACNNLAWVYIQTGTNLVKGRELVVRALTLTPDHRPYYLDTLGVLLLKLGNAEDAVPALNESLATLPKNRRDLLAEAEGHLAEAYKATGNEVKYQEALQRQRALQN
ncbi:MAG TPA: tetratricopeptide repeat protein [Nitrospirota bacterium]|nr:tetratricopeptide repeat protein [Nitrospirota bacterium]